MTIKTKKIKSALVDEYGKLRAQLNETEKRIEELKKIFDDAGTRDGDILKGKTYIIQYSITLTNKLDTEAIRKEMPVDWVKKYTIPGQRCTYKPVKVK